MTPTQIARRSDALYADGTCGMTRRVLCDMVAQREADIEDARAECAKLREELADSPKCETCEAMLDCDECLRADGSHKERRRLAAENAKLRELCVKALEWLRWAGGITCPPEVPDEFADELRELGVEVNDG